MKTIIQIAIAGLILTACVQGGRAALKHYQFVDALHEAMLFAGSRTAEQVAQQVVDIAGDHRIPLDPENVTVRREPFLVVIDAPYTEAVNLIPGVYQHPWHFSTAVNVRLLEDTRPRTPGRR